MLHRPVQEIQVLNLVYPPWCLLWKYLSKSTKIYNFKI